MNKALLSIALVAASIGAAQAGEVLGNEYDYFNTPSKVSRADVQKDLAAARARGEILVGEALPKFEFKGSSSLTRDTVQADVKAGARGPQGEIGYNIK
jgi:hypothetical protein